MTIREFPNRMGMDVTSGSARFEVWYPDLPIGHTDYKAKRIDGDGRGVAYKRGFEADSHEDAAQAVVADWRDNRSTWMECEP